jgi:hypothetical protein
MESTRLPPSEFRSSSMENNAADVRTRVSHARGFGAVAIGALAFGALALGALAIGRVAVGVLAIGKSRIRRLEVEELDVKRLRVEKFDIVGESVRSMHNTSGRH